MDDNDDGGIREWEENRFRRADEDARLLKEHAEWKLKFLSGLPTTKPKNGDNSTNDTTTERTI